MAKQLKTIQQFDGGFIDFSDARDIQEKDAVDALNINVRYVGRIKLLGGAISNSGVSDIALSNAVGLVANGTFFPYSTDIDVGNSAGGEDWLAYVNITTGDLWLYAQSDDTWRTATSAFGNGIAGNIGATNNTDSGFYLADGILRVSNVYSGTTDFSDATGSDTLWLGNIKRNYLAAVNDVKNDVSSTVVYAQPDNYHIYSARIPLIDRNTMHTEVLFEAGTTPVDYSATTITDACGGTTSTALVGTSNKFQNEQYVGVNGMVGWEVTGTNIASGAKVASVTDGNNLVLTIANSGTVAGDISFNPPKDGMFAIKAAIERGRGDGTLKLQGRKIYCTYTFDDRQESLPHEIDIIESTDIASLAQNLTAKMLGYEGLSNGLTSFNSGEIKLETDVRIQATFDDDGDSNIDNPDYKNWDNSGAVRVIDDNGVTQSLQYSGISDITYEIATITGSGTNHTVTTAIPHDLEDGDKVTVIEGTADFNSTNEKIITVASITMFSYVDSSEPGSTENVGTVTVHNKSKLIGVVGWVDNGYCSLGGQWGAIERIDWASGSTGYTDTAPANDVTISNCVQVSTSEDSGGAAIWGYETDVGKEFEAEVVLDDAGAIIDVNITGGNHGAGYDTQPLVRIDPLKVLSGTGASLTADGTGALESTQLCTQYGGAWSESSFVEGSTVEFDPPGELEELDENLGIRFILQGKPYDNNNIINARFGGNRLTHINLYTNKYEDNAGSIPETEDYAYICSFDLAKGFKKNDGTYQPWAKGDDGFYDQAYTYSTFFGSIFSDNFQGRTGMYPDTQNMHCRWETATVLNRRVYAGNVIIDGVKYPDRIIKSLPNRFDTFPEYDTLDVVVDDGDDIILIENFGGKLLQFKKKTLYVIDVSSQPEFLAGAFKYRGVPNKASVKRTDFGVVFCNSYGAFLYNGTDIKQLVQGKIETYWKTWWTSDVSVAFNPTHNYAIFKKSGSNDFLVHDLITASWMKGDGVRMSGQTTSDWFDFDGDMWFAEDVEADDSIDFFKWTDDPTELTLTAADNSVWESKEFVFDSPATDTIIHNVKITYKGAAESYMKAELLPYGTTANNPTVLGNFGSATEWTTIEFKLTPTVTCLSARIRITQQTSQTPDSGFEINDISIVYRSKRIK